MTLNYPRYTTIRIPVASRRSINSARLLLLDSAALKGDAPSVTTIKSQVICPSKKFISMKSVQSTNKITLSTSQHSRIPSLVAKKPMKKCNTNIDMLKWGRNEVESPQIKAASYLRSLCFLFQATPHKRRASTTISIQCSHTVSISQFASTQCDSLCTPLSDQGSSNKSLSDLPTITITHMDSCKKGVMRRKKATSLIV
jgi:hypothetical protein